MAEFERKLNENEAEFSIELINNIYSIVTKMLPEYFKNNMNEVKKFVSKTENDNNSSRVGSEERKFD